MSDREAMKLALEAIKAEREACAQLCDYAATECEYGGDGWYAAKTLAAAIRARGTLERLNDAASQSD